MSQRKIRVLIVDDSALVRSLLAEIVAAEHDMEVVGVARDPVIARTLVRELNPDVITLDVEMPRMNGLEFLERRRADKLHLDVPVVLVTTESTPDDEARGRAAGAWEYLRKPFQPADVERLAQRVLTASA